MTRAAARSSAKPRRTGRSVRAPREPRWGRGSRRKPPVRDDENGSHKSHKSQKPKRRPNSAICANIAMVFAIPSPTLSAEIYPTLDGCIGAQVVPARNDEKRAGRASDRRLMGTKRVYVVGIVGVAAGPREPSAARQAFQEEDGGRGDSRVLRPGPDGLHVRLPQLLPIRVPMYSGGPRPSGSTSCCPQ